MKKYCMVLALSLLPHLATAQMNDMLGVLAIDGMLDAEAYRGIGQMNAALDDVRFRQDLSNLITETQIASLNGYFDKSTLHFTGLSGIDWDVRVAAVGQYYIELKNLNAKTCELCKNGQWGTHHIEVNGASSCQPTANNVRLYF